MMAVKHVATDGRISVVLVPEASPEKTWGAGILVGPPDLSELGLGEEVTVRLHNELFIRGIVRRDDARSNRAQIVAALMATLKVDAERIIQIYEEQGTNA